MSVKTKSILFRNLLYVKEVVDTGSISAAAEKNGIKASNLSKLIKETEGLFGCVLFSRTAHGTVPTSSALKLVQAARDMENYLKDCVAKNASDELVRLYVSDGLLIKNLSDFEDMFLVVKEERRADVIVSVKRPLNADELVSTENKLGKDVVQSIWVCSKNTPQALDLARFIILQIHHQ